MLATPPTPFQSASLYIGDLHPEVTEGLLFELFNRVGPVASIRVCRDMVTRRSLGYAYVNFHNFQDAERALDTMNFTDIKSKPCRIMWSQRDPSLRKSGVGNVFVKNLPTTVDNKALYDIFSVFGNILSCKIATDENGVSKGYGYVHYETAEAAEGAITKLNGNLLEDAELYVGLFLKRQDRPNTVTWTNLYVKQFPLSWTDADLRSTFEAFGNIDSAKIAQDIDGKSKGFGWVDFAPDHEAALRAVAALNGKALQDANGQVIADPNNGAPFELYVSVAQKKIDRIRQRKVRPEDEGKNLYVKNIDETITDEQFRKEFSVCGLITSASIMRDGAGVSKGFGFVCFSNTEEATRAMAEMNGRMLEQKPLFVALHQRKQDRRNLLTASYNSRNGQAAMNRYPMGQAPMPYMQQMYAVQPGQQMQRQPYPNMMPGPMMPRGPAMPYGGRGGYPMPQYGVNTMQGGVGGFKGRSPMNAPSGGNRGRQMPPRPTQQVGGRPMMMGQQQQQQQTRMQQSGVNVRNSAVRNQQMPPQQMPSSGPLDHNTLALADPQTQKNMIGERLYPMILGTQPELAGKITGMLLEMDNAELLHLLESPEALTSKIDEALQVLAAHSGQ